MQNDMRDRIVELLNNYPCMSTAEDMFIESISDDLSDYLIANGVIIPPCKVGEIVYCIYNDQVIQGIVRIIRPSISKEEIIFKGSIIVELDSFFYDDGRKEKFELYVVFEKPYECDRVAYLTKDQAEQKLKEMRV